MPPIRPIVFIVDPATVAYPTELFHAPTLLQLGCDVQVGEVAQRFTDVGGCEAIRLNERDR